MSIHDMTNETGPVQNIDLQTDQAVIKLLNDIDLYRSPDVRVVLLELTTQKVPVIGVDLTGVPYMDSSGLATLVEALQRVKKYNGKLVLFGLQHRVRSIFEIARLTDLFTIQQAFDHE
ncbi:MAG: STAS domain-containing protein [Phycisphaerae bacterium]